MFVTAGSGFYGPIYHYHHHMQNRYSRHGWAETEKGNKQVFKNNSFSLSQFRHKRVCFCLVSGKTSLSD